MKTFWIVLLLPICGRAQSITITPGASLALTGTALLTIQDGGLINNGSFLPGSGTVLFSGTAATASSFIGGSSSTVFHHLTINKSSNDVLLNSDIAVNGDLAMQGGNLQLNNYTIDLGSGSGTILGESNTTRITGLTGGTVTKTAVLNAPAAVNPGNIGLEITSAANLGTTLIKRGHVQQTSSGGGLSIDRYFDIAPAGNSSLNATLKFYYFDNELAGRNKPELTQWISSDAGATWTQLGQDLIDNTNDWVLKNSIAGFNRMTLASSITNVLPLELLYFTGMLKDGETQLKWATENEYNNDHFDIERSSNGTDFTTLVSVKSYGNSSIRQLYQNTDPHPFNGYTYYRLKQVDITGGITYSSIIRVQNITLHCIVFPNPVADIFTLVITTSEEASGQMSLVDGSGRIVSERKVHLLRGSNTYEWDMSHLSAGTYYLHTLNSVIPVLKMGN